VNVGINCENDSNCASNVDISSALNAIELNTWSQVSVATSCFTQAGEDLSAITNAFSLSSAASVNIILSEIGYTDVSANTITCQ
ncbi:MAG: putative glycoside hydrolase, partial [Glaciecola sp.]|nr:putative glycoside hydrolase [Glaciecola sp.]